MVPTAVKKVKTGHCGLGHCEGTKPVAANGDPFPICIAWETCACDCHELVTKMYEMTGLDREPPEQSTDYLAWAQAQRHIFHMPAVYDGTILGALSSPDGTDALPDDERPVATPEQAVTDPVSAPAAPVFAPTPTGRRARGQLEYDVLAVCHEFSVQGIYDWEICTPKLVSEAIGKKYAIEPPSTGAINAVWDRWEALGFAVQDKKPSRFVKFTGGGTIQHLELLKARVKRDKKRGEAALKRDPLAARRR